MTNAIAMPPIVLSLTISQVDAIRRALLIGLSGVGEVERLVAEYDRAEMCGRPLDAVHKPIHASIEVDYADAFVTALTEITAGVL